MAIFSVSDAAMTGFGVIRRRPVLLLWWALLHLAFIALTNLVLVALAGPAMTQLTALRAAGPANDPGVQAQTLAVMHQLLPVYALMIPITLVFYAVLYAAMNRAVLRPADDRFGYLRLGMDEWRQILLFLWALVIGVALELVLVILIVIIAIIAPLVFSVVMKATTASTDNAMPAILGAVVVIVPLAAAWIYLLVRLSLASAMTFDTGTVSLLKSWRLTKGRFWPMLGAYVLSFCLAMVVGLLGVVVMLCIAAVATGGMGAFRFIFQPDMSSLAAYLTPARIFYLLLTGVLYALVWPVMLTPCAAIYRSVTAGAAEPATPWGASPPA